METITYIYLCLLMSQQAPALQPQVTAPLHSTGQDDPITQHVNPVPQCAELGQNPPFPQDYQDWQGSSRVWRAARARRLLSRAAGRAARHYEKASVDSRAADSPGRSTGNKKNNIHNPQLPGLMSPPPPSFASININPVYQVTFRKFLPGALCAEPGRGNL